MTQYIDKAALVAETERRIKTNKECMLGLRNLDYYQGKVDALNDTLSFIDTLEVKDPYITCVQYTNRESAIKAHAEDYSWNIESELFQQLTPEQQKMWRKEIEQACISGGYSGLNLAKDPRYKENLEVKEVDLEEEITLIEEKYHGFESLSRADIIEIIKHFFELGISINYPITSADKGMAEEVIFNLEKIEKDYNLCLTKEKEWVNKQAQKGEY